MMSMDQTLRISLYGGAGSGKSTVSAYIFSQLKRRHLNVELIQEWVKDWAYEKKNLNSTDQQYIYAKQQRKEDRMLRAGVKILVTDAPLYLNVFYAKHYKSDGWQELLALAKKFDRHHPSLHIFLDRGLIPYEENGRFQTKAEAIAIDDHILKFFRNCKIKYKTVKTEGDEAVDTVVNYLIKKEFLSVDKRVCRPMPLIT